MPSTINGIGTHYYGRRNQTARAAACASCKRVGNLTSYDTRLWFVVVFIPVIPLGRKRIMDQCPSCTRHFVMKAAAYEQAKQQQIAESVDRFRREPSVESAIAAHGQLLAFHENEQAAEFRKTALAHLAKQAAVRATMGAQLRHMSLFDDAATLFQQALDIDPQMPEARVGVAQRKMTEGELDDAQDLLDFLEETGAGKQHSLLPLDALAGHLQRAGRHEDAMRLAEVLLRELPKLADDHKFRGFVKRSEKALGRFDSILPERGFSLIGLFRGDGSRPPWQRKLALWSLAAAVIFGGLAFSNEYIRTHRTLHVLNATGQTAQVQVDDEPAVPINGLGNVIVAEGPHVIKVTGPVNETDNVDLESGYFGRWFRKPIWVVNLGGEGVLEDITHIYSASGTPSQHRLVVGERVFHRPNIDYIFTHAPDTVKVKHKGQEVTHTEVGWAQGDDLNAFLETIDANHAAAMDFAEKRLRRNPNHAGLLNEYLSRSTNDERGRIEAFLKSGLDARPVNIPWHRAFENVSELNNHRAELLTLYDKFLAADPSNAALLYLRGRIDPDWEMQLPFYRRSIEADPKLGWPWLALAARASSEGDWDECLKAALKTRELGPLEPDRVAEFLHEARMAKGQAQSLVEEYRARTNANTQDVSALVLLADALAASGQATEIDSTINAWLSRLPAQMQGPIAPHLKAMGLYYAGKLTECVEFCTTGALVNSSLSHLHALIALGRMKEATDDAVFGKLWGDPTSLLAVSVGFGLDGKPEEAARWREKAVNLVTEVGGGTDLAKAAKLLSASNPPSIKEVREFYVPPALKALILATLADQFPAKRAMYLTEAARFNVSHKISYQLIRKATAKKTRGKP